MPTFIVVTETVIRRAYSVDADGPESARALFSPNADTEDDGTVLIRTAKRY